MSVPTTKPRHAGFTFIELSIVVVILAILAVFVVPSFGASSEDAKASALKNNLSALRSAVELYNVQHNSRYPGDYSEVDGIRQTMSAAQAATAFVAQLSQYSDANGKVSATRSPAYLYGPYLTGGAMPVNPFLTGAQADDVQVDITSTDSTTVTASGATGWKFYLRSGLLVANDDLTLSDATTRTQDF